MAERNTAEELDDVYEIKYSTDAMTGARIRECICTISLQTV